MKPTNKETTKTRGMQTMRVHSSLLGWPPVMQSEPTNKTKNKKNKKTTRNQNKKEIKKQERKK